MLSRRALVMVGLSFSLAGCFEHRTLENDAGIDEGEDLAAWLAAVRTEMCRRQVECSPLFWWDTFGESTDACHPSVPVFFELDEAIERRARGELRFDPERAEACLTWLREGRGCLDARDGSFGSTCWEVFESASPLGAACDPRDSWCARGLRCDATSCRCEAPRVLGDRCIYDEECVADQLCAVAEEPDVRRCQEWRCGWDLQCEESEICADGVCIAAVPGAEGEACAGFTRRLCREGLSCAPDAICRRPAALGEPCSMTAASCESPFVCLDGTCGPRPAAGEPCRAHVQCPPEAPHCVGVRERQPGVCSASPVGRGCWPDIAFRVEEVLTFGTEDDECPLELVCAPYADALPGEWIGGCQPRVGRFDACSTSPVCPESTRCEGARCVPVLIPGSGVPCGPDALCPPTHACVDARCVPRPAVGERCNDAQRCIRGACVDGTCRLLPSGALCDAGGGYQCATGSCSAEGRCPAPEPDTVPCAGHYDCAERRVCVPTEGSTTCAPLVCGD